MLLVGIIWFVASMVKMLPRISDDFGRMIIFSITTMFALQIIYSLAMTTGQGSDCQHYFSFYWIWKSPDVRIRHGGFTARYLSSEGYYFEINEKIQQKVRCRPNDQFIGIQNHYRIMK